MRRSSSQMRAVAVLLALAAAFTGGVDCKRIFSSSRHTYPAHSGHSGHGAGSPGHGAGSPGHTHAYPHSPGLSGNSRPASPHPSVYNPPQQIHYAPAQGAAPHAYPVYHGPPPVYVNQIHDSGSKFSTILAGLALYNLGRSAAGVGGHGTHAQEKDNSGESCALRIVQDMNVERVKIPCYIVSTFTDAHDVKTALNKTTESTSPAPTSPSTSPATLPVTTAAPPTAQPVDNATSASVNTTSDASVNNTSSNPSENEKVSSAEGTVAVTATVTSVETATNDATVPAAMPTNATITTSATVASKDTKVSTPEPVEALQVKGEPVQLKKDARCFVERTTKTSSSTKEIECGLLQQYAVQSLQRPQPRSSAAPSALLSQLSVVALSIIVYLVH